jgi:hypothetical protein
MSPEFKILTINLVLLGFAYLWAYPSLPQKTWRAIINRDIAISCAAVFVSAALFAGHGIRFQLILLETNWFVFSALTMFVMEIPFFMWFSQKYDITFDAKDDD